MRVDATIDRARLAALLDRERAAYVVAHPTARALFAGATNLFGRVPMTWMAKWSGGFPLYLARAHGNRIVDVDGHEHVDFALGDTGAMARHSPRATVDAATHRLSREMRCPSPPCEPRSNTSSPTRPSRA